MSMSINTNVVSINAQRNLGLSGGSLAVSMQRLSSGLRVNSAKDDAAGLAIAERMGAQMRGLKVAARNANDGISLAQTAEGALGKMGDMLQRMRELAVQSSNATNSADDRKALQAEVAQLRSEIDRVAKTTSFNGQKILDGSFAGGLFQVGAGAGDNITVGDITNAKVDALGKVAYGASNQAVQLNMLSNYGSAIEAGTLKLRVGDKGAVDLDAIGEASSAQERVGQVVAAINAKTTDTGVTAFLEGDTAAGYTLKLRSSSEDAVLLQGFNLAQTGIGASVTLGNVGTVTAAAHKTAFDKLTVWESADATAFQGLLGALTTAAPTYTLSTDISPIDTALGTGAGNAEFDAASAKFEQALRGSLYNASTTAGTYNWKVAEDKVSGLQQAATEFKAAMDAAVWKSGEVNRTAVYSALDTVMAHSSATTPLNVGTLNGNTALTHAGIAGTAVTVPVLGASSTADDLRAAKNAVLSGVDVVMSGGTGVQTSEAQDVTGIDKIDIGTQAGSWEAIQQIDSALDQVNAARGKLGALQTRFEKTVENIDIMSENISAARGRIIDADFASETANLSRSQILQQAGTAMVAQANQLPQQVLSLLR